MPRQMYSQLMFLIFMRYVRNRIDHWCTVEPGNPNPRVHRSSGKLGKASFPTGTVDPRVGIFLSPLNTNDGFSLSRPRIEPRSLAWQSDTLPRRYKSRLVPGRKAVHVCIIPNITIYSPSILDSSPNLN